MHSGNAGVGVSAGRAMLKFLSKVLSEHICAHDLVFLKLMFSRR